MLVKSTPAPKVLHVTQKLGTGGLERVLVSLCLSHRESGLADPSVFAYDERRESSPFVADLERAGVPFGIEVKPPGFSWPVVRSILRSCEASGTRVLHTHDLNGLLYGALARLRSGGRLRVVHTQHTFLHIASRKQAFYERIFPRFADFLVAPTASLTAIYRKFGYPESKLRVIPNPVPFPAGIDRARGPALKRWGAAAEARLGSLPTGEVWALALGRVHPGKGQERVLELWPSLAANVRRRLRVLFVGPSADADYRASLESRARALPDGERLMWFPGVANPSACFAAADVYLSLSDFEGMPLAPVEAFAMGCPMVLSDIPGHRELALPGARYVSLSGADPALALGEALLGATPASAEDYARARDRFDPARVALDYARLYREADAR